jgi:ribosomal protein L14E/L6E/L27E
MGIFGTLFHKKKKQENTVEWDLSDEDYERLLEKARQIDEARYERMQYLKKHDRKKYNEIKAMEDLSCGL